MDHVALLTLITGILGALALFATRVFGEPNKRMEHLQRIEEIEARSEAARAKAHDRLVASWERRAETLETRQALLDAANQSLRARIDELERQVARAGNVHVADLATIANLREELDQYVARCTAHEVELAVRDRRIADLEARVAELEEALRDGPSSRAWAAKLKPAASAKKKGGKK